MITRRPSATLVLVTLPLILLGLFLAGMGRPGSAAALPQTDTAPAPLSRLGSGALITPTQAYTVYLPLQEKHERVPSPLRNGDFEADWSEESSKDCVIFYTDGSIEETYQDNILTPPGWLTWYKWGTPVEHDATNPFGWMQPEVRDARAVNPDRMHGGVKGQVLFKTWGVHDSGFMQQVPTVPGQYLRLNGWAHAWSNTGGTSPNGIDSDPYWSEGSHVGYTHFFALEGTEGLDDGDRNHTFWLGIDPTGGTNPYAGTVVWGQGSHIYNAYQPVPEITTRAQGTTATVFLRVRVLWPFKHTDAYWDDIELDVIQ